MNHIYRLVWSDALRAFVPVAESRPSRGKLSRGIKRRLSAAAVIAASGAALAGPPAGTLPTGGQVTAGSATMSVQGNTLDVQQSSQRAAIDWQSFSIGSAATVNFLQPNASAVVLNRVVGGETSVIDGVLHADGQVFLLNSNGVLFGKGASVDTAGLIASTLNLADADFMAGRTTFSGNGKGSILNLGTLNAASGGYIALLGGQVRNQGVITARLGTAVLAAGNTVSLNFNGNSLLGVTIDTGALRSLVQNNQAIIADGGTVILTAKGLDSVLGGVVNNTGLLQAQTISNQSGHIYLLGDMQTGTVNVDGTLDASAPNGGNGGAVETSAATVKIANCAQVTTASMQGLAGSWLIDPHDFTIAATGGDITGTLLSTELAAGNVIIQSDNGASGTAGDINVNAPVSWSANTLTLVAQNDININASLNGSGTAALFLHYGLNGSSTATYNVNAAVNLPAGASFSTQQGTNSAVNYTVITSLGAAGSTTGTDLQGIAGNLSGNYALGADIDASATTTWNSGAGFAPLGATGTAFTGSMQGLGHTITGLYINSNDVYVGLFGNLNGPVSNLTLASANVTSTGSNNNAAAGILAGNSGSLLSNDSSSGTVTYDRYFPVGGLVGTNGGTIENSTSSATISGWQHVGGLVGGNYGLIIDSSASGNVTGTNHYVGGLVGSNTGSINGSYATGAVNGGSYVGGLLGVGESGSVDSSYATGSVTGSGEFIGGLVGFENVSYSGNNPVIATVSNSYATGQVSGGTYVGGLVGAAVMTRISNSYSTGNVSGTEEVGGLIGNWDGTNGGILSNSFYDADAVTVNGGHQLTAGALFDAQYQDWFTHGLSLNISNYASTLPAGSGGYYNISSIQGLEDMLGFVESNAGYNFRLLTSLTLPAGYSVGYFAGSFDGSGHTLAGLAVTLPNSNVGLFGYIPQGTSTITNIGVSGVNLATGTDSEDVGGLIGLNTSANVTNAYATGSVTGGYNVGGLVGYNAGGLTGQSAGGAISNTYFSGSVTGGSYVGGLVGYNNTRASITNSYSAGDVSGVFSWASVGGLAGANYGTIDRSYSSAAVHNANYGGGLVGMQYGTITNSFYNSTVNPGLTGAANWSGSIADSVSGISGLTTSQMTAQANFAAFDFSNTWFMYEGETNPMLRTFLTPLTVGPANVTTIYNGTAYAGGSGLSFTAPTGDGQVLGTPVYGGTGQGAVNAGAYTLTVSGLYSDQQGYILSYAPGSLTIAPRPVTVSTISGATEVYNGSTSIPASLLTITNLVSGDSVALSGTGTLAGSAAGSENLVGLSGLSLNNPNYTLQGAVASGSVLITAATSSGGSSGGSSGNGNSGGAVPAADSAISAVVASAVLTTQLAPAGADSPVTAVTTSNAGVSAASAGAGNLVVSTASLPGTFGQDGNALLVSDPSGDEPTLGVSLSQARQMLGGASTSSSESANNGGQSDGNSSGTASNGPQDVRVPVGRNSLVQIVNGGVRLPTGVDQQLFVVKAHAATN